MSSERYFGLHFDFHAGNEAKIGVRTDPADIEWYIDEAKPDFIQCDCKGHPGNTSYPTRVGKAAEHLVQDNLKIWSDTVHGRGLPLYVHYSGVYEMAYTAAHPDQAAADESGQPTQSASVFGKYCDELLIPELKEVIDRYGIDGAWIDGDCWSVRRDYSENARPLLGDGVSHEEHNRIMREGFLAYVRKYVDAVHAYKPSFRIASNWLYTSQVPEKPEIGVDFISGDFTSNDSAHAARFEGRCIALQGKPWDLMAWGFSLVWDNGMFLDKPAYQLMQEAAVVLSLGGGFQVYITQNPDGSARRERSGRLRRLHDFMEPRRAVNFGKPPKAQIGIFYSARSRYSQTAEDPCVFNPAHVSDGLNGAMQCILDAQYSLDCILEHRLDRLSDYEAVVVPEWERIPEEDMEKLLRYARNGGKLVILGAELCRQVGERTGTDFGGIEKNVLRAFTSREGDMATFCSDYIDLRKGEGTIYSGMDLRDAALPAFRIEQSGAGQIAYVPFNLGTVYFQWKSYYLSEYMDSVLRRLCTPWAGINRREIDLCFQQDGDGLLLNLVNMRQGRHELNMPVFEEIPTVRDVEVRLHRAYSEVSMPLGEDFTWEVCGDQTVIRLPELHIHSVIRLK